MGTTYRFLATVEEAAMVPEWFRTLNEPPAEAARDGGFLFHFRHFGPLDSESKNSPIVNVCMPAKKCGVLTTIGEVHFLATPLSKFAGLFAISKSFRKWLKKYPCVYSHRIDAKNEWNYLLEGSVKNWDSDIFALPAGMAALQRGAYFVANDDNGYVLDRVCRALELRGVEEIERPNVNDA